MNNHEVDIGKERFITQKVSGLTVLQWCKKTILPNIHITICMYCPVS